jgi:hypothetical protein
MSAIGAILAGVASKVGATLVKNVLEGRLGASVGQAGGDLAGTVIDTIAEKAGVAPEKLPDLPEKDLGAAIRETEAIAPELIQLWQAGLAGQFALLQAEQNEAWFQSAWRWGWMYLLAFFWTWRIIILPVINAGSEAAIEAIDLAVLLTLTTWFISLYMGGHTVKALGESAINAVRSWRDKPADNAA